MQQNDCSYWKVSLYEPEGLWISYLTEKMNETETEVPPLQIDTEDSVESINILKYQVLEQIYKK